MRRLSCREAACLKQAAESLAPSCAAFLLSEPEPSPAPKPISQHVRHMSSGSGPSGYFTVMSSSSDGEVRRISGPLSASGRPSIATSQQGDAQMMMMLPSSFGSLLGTMLPPEVAQLLIGMPPLINMQEIEHEDEAEPAEARHPCAREVALCTREAGSASRDAIESCLVQHLEQLSPECKCFVHHMANSRTSQQAPSAPRPAELTPIAVRTVPTHPGFAEPPPMRQHPVHQLSCLFLFTAFFVITFLLVRACVVSLLFSGRAPRAVVVVPPERTKIKTINAPPLLIADMKMRAPTVQVAEPLAKA